MTDDTRNLAVVAFPSGIAYVYVGNEPRRMRFMREPLPLGYSWSVHEDFIGGTYRGSVFKHWHEMMAYALERQALTPAEYQAAYEMREAI